MNTVLYTNVSFVCMHNLSSSGFMRYFIIRFIATKLRLIYFCKKDNQTIKSQDLFTTRVIYTNQCYL